MQETWWVVEWLDGRTDEAYGKVTASNGVLSIVHRAPYDGPVESVTHYAIANLRKWKPKDMGA